MPVYEYECLRCGGRIEELQKFTDAPPKKHNGCGGRLKRLLSAPAIQFKGSGFYITDYARRGKGVEGAEGNAKKEAAADAKTEAKSSAADKADKAGQKDASPPTKTKTETKS